MITTTWRILWIAAGEPSPPWPPPPLHAAAATAAAAASTTHDRRHRTRPAYPVARRGIGRAAERPASVRRAARAARHPPARSVVGLVELDLVACRVAEERLLTGAREVRRSSVAHTAGVEVRAPRVEIVDADRVV